MAYTLEVYSAAASPVQSATFTLFIQPDFGYILCACIIQMWVKWSLQAW